MNERILSVLGGEYATAREVAEKLGVPAGQGRAVIEALRGLVAEGRAEQEPHDGLDGSGPKRYRLHMPALDAADFGVDDRKAGDEYHGEAAVLPQARDKPEPLGSPAPARRAYGSVHVVEEGPDPAVHRCLWGEHEASASPPCCPDQAFAVARGRLLFTPKTRR